MSKIAIVDYQLGNLFSVRQAMLNIGLDVFITQNPVEIQKADAVVLPGVGAFSDAMDNLQKQGMDKSLQEFVLTGKPFMGVCLGLQLLFSESEEFGVSKGLGILPGMVKRFKNIDEEGNVVKVPQIAWNEIYSAEIDWSVTPLKSLAEKEHMYFVHSFYVEPYDKTCILSKTTYRTKEYTSAVIKNNIFACQFHPEKSAEKGLTIYRNWALQNNLI